MPCSRARRDEKARPERAFVTHLILHSAHAEWPALWLMAWVLLVVGVEPHSPPPAAFDEVFPVVVPLPTPPVVQLSDNWASLSQLAQDPEWHRYLDAVYNVSTLRFPFSLLQLHTFYSELLPSNVSRGLHLRKQDQAGDDVGIIGAPLRFGELYRLWGGDMPTTGWSSIHIWRCIYPVGQCTVPGASTDYGICDAGAALGPEDGVLYSGLPSHSKAEVTHRVGDPPGSGLWMYW